MAKDAEYYAMVGMLTELTPEQRTKYDALHAQVIAMLSGLTKKDKQLAIVAITIALLEADLD